MVSNGKRISKFMCGSTDSYRSKPLSSQHRADEQRSYNDFGRVSLDEPDGGIVSGDKNWTDNEQSNTYLNPQSNAYHKPQSNVHSHIKPQDSAGPKPASIPPYHKLSIPEKYRPSPVKHNMQVIRGNATFVQLYKQRKHFNQIMRAAKDVSTIFKFLTCVVLDELDSLNFLKAANTLAQSGEAPPDLLSIILYLNHVLHVFDHREEIITLINTLYDRHSDYFLYVLRDHVLRNDDVKEVLAVVQHQSVHVFMCALAESNKQAVNSFFVDLMICRARMGSAILLSNVFKLVRYDRHAPKKCAFVVCTHRKRYNIDYTPIIQHLKDEAHMYTNINVLHALISIAGDDEHVVALIHAKMHKMRYRTMKRYGMSIKVLMCVFMARDVRKSNDIALFVNAMHELEDLSVNFNEREKRLYDELLVVLMENEKCMDVMVERMLDRVYGLVVLRNKRRRVGAYRVSACCRCGEKTCDGNENDEGVGVTVGSRKNAQRVAHDDTRNNKKRIKDCVCDEIGDEKKRRKIEKKIKNERNERVEETDKEVKSAINDNRVQIMAKHENSKNDQKHDSSRNDQKHDNSKNDQKHDNSKNDQKHDNSRNDQKHDNSRNDQKHDNSKNDQKHDNSKNDQKHDNSRNDQKHDNSRNDQKHENSKNDQKHENSKNDQKHDNSKNVSDTVLVRLNNRAEYMRRMKELIRSGNKFVIKHVRALAVNTKEVFELVDEVPLRTKLLLLAELPGDIHSYHHVVHEGLEDDDTGTVMLCYRVIRKHKEMTNDELFTRRVLKSILVNVRREESFYECVHLLIGLLRGVRVDRRDVLRVMHIVNDRMNTVNKRFRERIGTLYCCMGRWVDVRSVVNLMMDNLRVCDRVQRVMGVVVLSKMGVRYFCEVVAVLLMDYGMREFNVKVGVIRVLERIVKYYVGRYCGVTHHDMGRYSTNYCNMVCSNADNYRYALHKYGNCEQRGSGKICDIARHKCIKNEKYKRYLRAHEITAKTYAIEDKKRRAKNRKYVRVSSKLIKYIIPVLNNALTQNDKTLRKCALQLLKHVLHLHITTEHLIHLFNISFVNLLCDDEIKDVFDECFVLFVRKLSSNYVFKYLVSGLEHPSHSVRERYVELLAMVQRNGVLIESVDDDEFIDSVF